jgi:hypothetical protein
MTVEERAGDPAGERAVECLVMLLRLPRGDDVVAPDDALHPQAALIARAASEARSIRRVSVLKRFVAHPASLTAAASRLH